MVVVSYDTYMTVSFRKVIKCKIIIKTIMFNGIGISEYYSYYKPESHI